MSNPYNQLDYPGQLRIQAHPRRLETIARLHGLTSAPAATCRVLELGCGDGLHLIAIGAELPETRCVGFDLAESGIRIGNEIIARLGLTNVSLHQGDLMALGEEQGQFDYIVAHGLYSWVPQPVRDGILALCGRLLAPAGVAYISYHTLPGGHLRRMVDEMMRFHVRHLTDPLERIAAAREFSRTLTEWRPDDNAYTAVLRQERDRIAELKDYSVFHDNLSDWNTPILVSNFVAHAGQHGLNYLGEADFTLSQPRQAPPSLLAAIEGMSRLDREQHLDFWAQRVFRQTLLCRAEQAILDRPDPDTVTSLYVSGHLYCHESDPAKLTGEDELSFQYEDRKPPVSIEIAHPALKLALQKIIELWPQPISFDAWVESVRQTLAATAPGPYAHMDPAHIREGLKRLAYQGYGAGFLDLAATPPRVTASPGEKPRAFDLARLQAASGAEVTSLVGKSANIEDSFTRQVLRLLDGSRTRADICRELLPLCLPGSPDQPPELRAVPDVAAALPALVDESIAKLIQLALFEPE